MLLARPTRPARAPRWTVTRQRLFSGVFEGHHSPPDDVESLLLARHPPSFLSDEWGLTFGERLRVLARTSAGTSRTSFNSTATPTALGPHEVSQAVTKSNPLSVSLFRPSPLPNPQLSTSLSSLAVPAGLRPKTSPSVLRVAPLSAHIPSDAVSLLNFLEGKILDRSPTAHNSVGSVDSPSRQPELSAQAKERQVDNDDATQAVGFDQRIHSTSASEQRQKQSDEHQHASGSSLPDTNRISLASAQLHSAIEFVRSVDDDLNTSPYHDDVLHSHEQQQDPELAVEGRMTDEHPDIVEDVDASLDLDQHRTTLESIDHEIVVATDPHVPIPPAFNPGNLGPQSVAFFRAQFVKDVARGEARQAVRRMHRLLFKKSFLYTSERAQFFSTAIAILLDHGEYEIAGTLHEWMAGEGFITPPALLIRFLRAAVAEDEVAECLSLVTDAPVLVDEPLFTRALSKLRRVGEAPQALVELVQSYSTARGEKWKPGRGIVCIMINVCASVGDFTAADGWLQTYRTTTKLRARAPYTALLAAYVRAHDNAAALRVLEMMHTDGIEPPLAVFNMLLTLRPAEGEPHSAGVERAFRVARIMPPEIWDRADAFTFGALFKAHERWRADIITRTGPPTPHLRALFRAMVARGVRGLETLAMRVFLVRHDYAGALVALDAHRAADARTRAAVEGALWRRMRGEVGAEAVAEARISAHETLLDDIGVLHRRRSRVRKAGRESQWTDSMLAEPGGLHRRGAWLRQYVASGNTSGPMLDGVFEWLLHDAPVPADLPRHNKARRHGINPEPLRVLLRRALLASKDVSVLAPASVQVNVLSSELGRARAEMLPTTAERKSKRSEAKSSGQF